MSRTIRTTVPEDRRRKPVVQPQSLAESRLMDRLRYPHDVWANHDEALRIARRRWKRARSKLLRQQNRSLCQEFRLTMKEDK